ncbi:hypothetical protein EJB05_35922, partial [Eragrostis curvula]
MYLNEDNAAKVSDISFYTGKKEGKGEFDASDEDGTVYKFALLLLEIISGRRPYSLFYGHMVLIEKLRLCMIDPTLNSVPEEQVRALSELIRLCISEDPRERPTIAEVTKKMQDITGITEDKAIPRSDDMEQRKHEQNHPYTLAHSDQKSHLLLLVALLRRAWLSHDSDGGDSGGILPDNERNAKARCLSPPSVAERYLLLVPRSAVPHLRLADPFLSLPLQQRDSSPWRSLRSFSRTSPSVRLRRGGEGAVAEATLAFDFRLLLRAAGSGKPSSTGLALQGKKNMSPHALADGDASSPCSSSSSTVCAAASLLRRSGDGFACSRARALRGGVFVTRLALALVSASSLEERLTLRRGDGRRLGCLYADVVAMALAAGRKRSMMKLGDRRDPAAPSMSDAEILSSASENVSPSSSLLASVVVFSWHAPRLHGAPAPHLPGGGFGGGTS